MTALRIAPRDERVEELRTRLVEKAKRERYNPWLHIGIPTALGLSVLTFAIISIQNLHPVELLTIPIIFVLSNATEWRAHRDWLHKRNKLVPFFYDRHTPEHHVLFVTDNMAVRSRVEWRLVLIPAYAHFILAFGNLPIAAALYFLVSPNVAFLYGVSTIGYVVAYEWLHLSFHLDPESFVGRLGIVRFLRRHHATHHDPRLMQHYNFNVVFPLWDLVRGTYVPASERQEAVIRPRHGT